MASNYRGVNLMHAIPDVTGAFDMTCPAGTDIWDKPPSIHDFNAPLIYQSTTKDAFISATVTVSANFKDEFDQGGICLAIKAKDRTRWVKASIEVVHGVPGVCTVVKDDWADASLREMFDGWTQLVTVEVRLSDDGSLTVHAFGPNGQHASLREITWWGAIPGDTEIWVGPYVAKPAPNGEKGDFTAHFEGLSIKTR
ncbi:hypothetical protein BGW36DRAFT_377014 [Talaromyces proteolyticus]|uniref:Uncharacterized protein n=1 Tax=Talaromyces proteolyticus TaxID=1131652 RepID=A0AAD4KV14_9EURO|nr:uncharacterized protein BGW36DRAFT_377014 [Talaromyces proteolyticus]KAH8698949.1 hypothetical protein BGW36DRAFT_377014 [Talaromyces proteolyticus]